MFAMSSILATQARCKWLDLPVELAWNSGRSGSRVKRQASEASIFTAEVKIFTLRQAKPDWRIANGFRATLASVTHEWCGDRLHLRYEDITPTPDRSQVHTPDDLPIALSIGENTTEHIASHVQESCRIFARPNRFTKIFNAFNDESHVTGVQKQSLVILKRELTLLYVGVWRCRTVKATRYCLWGTEEFGHQRP